jgi:chemotaxis protein CheX
MSHIEYYPEGGWSPLIESAAREVFEVMLGTKLEPFRDDPALVTEMIAMVGLSGRVAGVMSFHCTAQGARKMATKMLGSAARPMEEDDDTARDAVGEICNMVAGTFKNKLGQVGNECKLSVPTIISGAECSMQANVEGTHVQMPFSFEGMPIAVALNLRA